jgi:DNA topoisomerase IB
MYALTVFSTLPAMMLMDKKEAGDTHFTGCYGMSGQLDVPDDVHISITFCTSRSVHHAHTERVHLDLASYLLNQVDQPATKLKSLIDSNTEFYVMSGSQSYRWIRSGATDC